MVATINALVFWSLNILLLSAHFLSDCADPQSKLNSLKRRKNVLSESRVAEFSSTRHVTACVLMLTKRVNLRLHFHFSSIKMKLFSIGVYAVFLKEKKRNSVSNFCGIRIKPSSYY